MSDVVKMHTSLPGLDDVRIWLDPGWIVVLYGDRLSSSRWATLDSQQRADMADALAEAKTLGWKR